MGFVVAEDGIRLFYEEYGEGENVILSGQIGFYPEGMHRAMARKENGTRRCESHKKTAPCAGEDSGGSRSYA